MVQITGRLHSSGPDTRTPPGAAARVGWHVHAPGPCGRHPPRECRAWKAPRPLSTTTIDAHTGICCWGLGQQCLIPAQCPGRPSADSALGGAPLQPPLRKPPMHQLEVKPNCRWSRLLIKAGHAFLPGRSLHAAPAHAGGAAHGAREGGGSAETKFANQRMQAQQNSGSGRPGGRSPGLDPWQPWLVQAWLGTCLDEAPGLGGGMLIPPHPLAPPPSLF
jgi:hypothetical protein